MQQWNHIVDSLTRDDIMFAIQDMHWQKFRKSLKGIATDIKLDRLEEFLRCGATSKSIRKILVDNYINALLRGGQLIRKGTVIIVQR